MLMRIIAAAGIAAAGAAPALAQEAQGEPTQEQMQTAVKHFNVVGGALTAEAVPMELKNALFSCVYGNAFRQISENASGLIAANEQLKADDPQSMLTALAAVCGFQPPAPAAPPAE